MRKFYGFLAMAILVVFLATTGVFAQTAVPQGGALSGNVAAITPLQVDYKAELEEIIRDFIAEIASLKREKSSFIFNLSGNERLSDEKYCEIEDSFSKTIEDGEIALEVIRPYVSGVGLGLTSAGVEDAATTIGVFLYKAKKTRKLVSLAEKEVHQVEIKRSKTEKWGTTRVPREERWVVDEETVDYFPRTPYGYERDRNGNLFPRATREENLPSERFKDQCRSMGGYSTLIEKNGRTYWWCGPGFN